MRILGVDPGSFATGWGLIGGAPPRPVLVDCGQIRLPKGGSLPARLHRLRVEFEGLLARLAPAAAAVEAPFHGVNARAALQLAHARGVVLALLGGAGVPVEEYAPATIKKSVTGNGRAEKAQVRLMVWHLLGRRTMVHEEDLADALAVALCHAASLSFASAVEKEKGSSLGRGIERRKPRAG